MGLTSQDGSCQRTQTNKGLSPDLATCLCVHVPQVDVPSLRRIRKVSLGACHAMAARADERVHVWGSDRAASGCLGGAHLGAIGGGATTTAGGVGGGTAAGPGAGAGAGPQQPLVMSRPAMFRYWFTDVACGFAHSAGGWPGGGNRPGCVLCVLALREAARCCVWSALGTGHERLRMGAESSQGTPRGPVPFCVPGREGSSCCEVSSCCAHGLASLGENAGAVAVAFTFSYLYCNRHILRRAAVHVGMGRHAWRRRQPATAGGARVRHK